jgi:hypothetical protein
MGPKKQKERIENTVRTKRQIIQSVLTAGFVAWSTLGMSGIASAGVYNTATMSQTDPRPSATAVTNVFTVSNVTSTLIRCVKVQYSTSTTSFTAVPGITTTAATVNAGSTLINSSLTGWTLNVATNGVVTNTNATGITPSTLTGATYRIDAITNGSTVGTTYFALFNSYSDVACTTAVDNVQIAYVYTNGQAVTITVDPTMTFTVTGVASGGSVNGATTNVTTTSTTVPLGTPTTTTNQIAAQDLAVTTNAGSGYTVYARYTAAPTSTSYTLADWTGSNATPTVFSAAGTEAFGYTTNDFTLGTGTAARFSANKWAAFTATNNEVAFDSVPVSAQTTRVGFQVGISGLTKAGNYTTTVIYTATPVF